MSVDVGLLGSSGYTLVMKRVTVVHALRPAVAARWVGLANYRYIFGTDSQVVAARQEHDSE